MSYLLSLNTSTIRDQKLTVPQQIDVAHKAGYTAIEPWMRDLVNFRKDGGKVSDLAKQLNDTGLKVPSAIGFAKWIVDDDAARAKGLDEAKHDCELLAELGATGIAAPPEGAREQAELDLDKAAERYAKLIEVCHSFGIVPIMEFWGFARSVRTLKQAIYVADHSNSPEACVLADIYHMHRSEEDPATSLSLIDGKKIRVVHMNDYPATPPAATITDADRVWPGDGVAPIRPIVDKLLATGFAGTFSLELFNKEYWKLDALDAATVGLKKMKASIEGK